MAEGPYKLCDVPTVVGEPGDYAESFYWDMAITHNCYLRALNSVWINAPKVHPADELSFVGYCLVVSCASCLILMAKISDASKVDASCSRTS